MILPESGESITGLNVVCNAVSVQFPGGARGGETLTAVESFSARFVAGTITSLVGPSGCGKTTLLRVIAGLQAASSGTIHFNPPPRSSDSAPPAAGLPPAILTAPIAVRPSIGMVFQSPALLPWLTCRENIELPLRLGNEPERFGDRRQRADAVDLLLEQVELTSAADRYPRQLSGGMQMRVSLARGLVTSPSLLLLDEPFAALDEVLRQQLGELLHRLHTDRSFTAIMVTHNIAESIALSHRILVMQRGRLLESVDNPLSWPRPAAVQSDPRFAPLHARISTLLQNHNS